MLINLWYVAEWSHAVTDKPVKVQMLGRKFVLFRDTRGKVNCLSDICLHRGGSLSGGWTKGDCVACPYHGWRFSGEGKVEHIPSEGEDFNIPDKARIDAYPTEERYGMIWVFLGDQPEEERFPIPELPEYGDDNWKLISDEWTWKAEAARVVENGIDIAHASFVHPIFGMEATAQENQIVKVEKGEHWGYSENVQYPPQMKENFLRRRIRKDRQPTVTKPEWNLSGMLVRIQIDLNEKMSLIMFDANTPIDEHTTRTFALQFRNFFKQNIFDKGSRKRLRKILAEDTAIVEAASPNYLPDSLANELSVKDDKFMSSFRSARRKLIEEKGWKIDSEAAEKFDGRKALVIPSPLRRERDDLDWVIDTVPLIDPIRKPAQATGT
ncbi:aromatic ring-hydroxylating dioxygenase subunit alpha [Halioglobus maricola]|uniref:Aromatic ring-hydroxylating dioxygenase subunit alpha n=1 Tax=Halioglobus maricola TaxID=2601894 RepID=A0A5P9NEY4_9GAMM|nr:aromatic ring-hydroxylating dioxygenase subunit alpha [Halioglobus maricola]QFU74311.1 aromatic ring-hydroxylating dioxygenase subunit alpha [Halioglobus maricola]